MLASRLAATAAIAAHPLAAPCAAQNYPDRVVKIVNPFPAGGSVDITARILAQKLSDLTGHSFIVENANRRRRQHRFRRGGEIRSRRLHAAVHRARSAHRQPEPFTKPLPFDPVKDFAPIALFALDADRADGQSQPAGQEREGPDRLCRRPIAGKVNFGSAGIGSIPHLSGELFKSMAEARNHRTCPTEARRRRWTIWSAATSR